MASQKVRRLSVYERIMRAARRGTGMYLRPEDVGELASDHAVHAAAAWDREVRLASERASKADAPAPEAS